MKFALVLLMLVVAWVPTLAVPYQQPEVKEQVTQREDYACIFARGRARRQDRRQMRRAFLFGC